MRLWISVLLASVVACHSPRAPDVDSQHATSASATPPGPAAHVAPEQVAPEQPLASPGTKTAWHDAAKAGDLAKLEALIESDPGGLHKPDERGLTPLHHAAAASAAAVKLLLDASAKVRARSVNGTTPLYVAARMNKPEVAKLLLARGAAVDERGADDNTPLQVASFRATLEVVDILLKHGASPTSADKVGTTPLHVAAMADKADIVARLIEAGADVHATDVKGNTPLHTASKLLDAVDAAKALLAAGARLDAKNAAGMTPHALATGEGRAKLAAALSSKQ